VPRTTRAYTPLKPKLARLLRTTTIATPLEDTVVLLKPAVLLGEVSRRVPRWSESRRRSFFMEARVSLYGDMGARGRVLKDTLTIVRDQGRRTAFCRP
jgi:hypothetical protein